ncbi:MAG: HD domain-containing protein [Methanobacteriaceae archaeon]
MFIRDSIHGDLNISSFEKEVLDSPQLQRLRHIKQLGLISLVYPGANHSRFEHSIGTMYLASKIANHLNLDEDEKDMVRISALLHDTGHGPFSHVSEPILGNNHEEITANIIKDSSINDLLLKKFSKKDIADIIGIINGEGYLGPIISGELDADRMDYLIRDSHYTGVAYGVIDVERIISNMKLSKYLVLDIKGVQAAESALVARYFMYPSVYQHHTTRIINSMFRRCLESMITENILDLNNMSIYDDADMLVLCRNQSGFIKDIINRLDTRNLFKRVYALPLNNFERPQDIFKIKKDVLKKCEEEIALDLGIDEDYLILNIPEFPAFDEMKTQVAFDNKVYHLSEISSIVSALKNARFNYPDIAIYTRKEDKDKFKNFKLENYLDLPEESQSKPNSIHLDQAKLF